MAAFERTIWHAARFRWPGQFLAAYLHIARIGTENFDKERVVFKRPNCVADRRILDVALEINEEDMKACMKIAVAEALKTLSDQDVN